jgi:uncharacterized repeat protein (TIGR01451 family)
MSNLGRYRSSLAWLTGLVITIAASLTVWVNAHSVAQVQTTKYFAPETVNLLVSRASSSTPGFVVGDTLNYIIEFTPVANSATVGGGGYITDYIPPGTEVVGASIVQPDGSGGYSPTSPDLPGTISNGWGAGRGQRTFDTDWTGLASIDAATRAACISATLGYGSPTLANCNASLAQIYADTGIFYSTDTRTQVSISPNTDGRVRQGCTTNTPAGNGYNINNERTGQLNPIIGQSCATTHNLWDANQANAFGSIQTKIDALTGLKSSSPSVGLGLGATPYNAGSAVAGLDSGYKLDNTGNTGPWRRIAYMGSRIGNATGPATTAIASNTSSGVISSATAVVGQPTSSGWSLSPANPLPVGTNAVRWAVGQLVAGQLKFVKISLRLTAPIPGAGMINNSEVFGGDSAEAAGKIGQDSPWPYHVPSVADNTTNLFVLKTVKCVFVGAICVPSDGSSVAANAKIRYSITYLNTSNGLQTNLVLSDTLPCQTAANAVKQVSVISGFAFGSGLPLTAAGSCTTTSTAGATVNFATIPSLSAGQGGTIEVDVQTNAAVGSVVSNRARLISDQVPTPGATSNVASSVINTANVQIGKTTSTPNISPNGTATYTITISNSGAAAASNIVVTDFLPTNGGTTAADRFSFVTGSSTFGGPASVIPAVISPPTIAPFTGLNRDQVTWTFTGQTLAVGASWTITFQAKAGASVPASTSAFTNDAQVSYNNSVVTVIDLATATAPVFVGLSVSGRVFENFNYGGGVGRAFVAASGMALVPNARVELYSSAGIYLQASSTDALGKYSFSGLSASTSYTIRVVNGTVASTRVGGGTCAIAVIPCVPVQTFRTNASSGTAVAALDRVGGENPSVSDAGSNLTVAPLPANAQSLTTAALGSSSLTGLDFGFNFDTVVNKNDAGQGSLRQFIINSNGLSGEANLAQSGSRTSAGVTEALPATKESSIFMASDGLAHPGIRVGLTNQLTGNVLAINVSSLLPAISAPDTVIDGTTQTFNVGNLNSGVLGTGGTVGVDALALPQLERPEVQLFDANTLTLGLDLQANTITIRGLSIYGFGNIVNSDANANIRIGNNFTGTLIEQNMIGSPASGFNCPGAGALSGGDNIRSVGGDSGTIRNNLIGCGASKGIALESASLGWAITANEVRGNAIGNASFDGIDIENSGSATVSGNLFVGNTGVGIDSFNGTGGNMIANNTVTGNGIGSSGLESSGVRLFGTGSTVRRNIINANYGAGISVTAAFDYGFVNITTPSSGNTISQNSIFANGTIAGSSTASAQIGIDLLNSTDSQDLGTSPFVTLNDAGDADAGGNALLNFPVVESAAIQGGNLILKGFARPGARLEFFVAAPDPSGFGEGQTYLLTSTEGCATVSSTCIAIDADATSGTYSGSINGLAQGTDTTNRFQFTVPLPSGVTLGTVLTATATCLTSDTCSSAPNGSTSEFSGIVPVKVQADLAISKSDGATTAIPGSAIVYTITVSNPASTAIDGVTVTDSFPATLTGITWTCLATGTGSGCPASGSGNLSSVSVNLGATGSVAFTVNATINSAATGTLDNTASLIVPASVFDPVTTNNSATDSDTLTPRADLSLTKTVDNALPVLGSNVTFSLKVTNAGPSDTNGVVVKDLLPSGLVYVSSTPSAGTSYVSGTGLWTVGTLTPGAFATLDITATVNSRPITNSAEVTASSATDPDSTVNNGTGNGEDDQASASLPGNNISGTVFEDQNHNGLRDAGEPIIFGVTITLSGTTGLTTTTDTNGAYSFNNLSPGAYTVTETDPSGYVSSTPNSFNITLVNTNATVPDFGDYHGSRITGNIFRDNGLTGGTANDALRNGGEAGVSNLNIKASDGVNSTSSLTNLSGDYELWIPSSFTANVTVSHLKNPATGTNIGGASIAQATGFNAAAARSRTISGFSSGQTYSAYNFGVVEASILQPDQIGQASSPGAITYLHLFRPGTLGTVALNLTGLPGWGHLIYVDANCDGTVSSAEHTSPILINSGTSLTVTATWPRESDGRLKACALEIVTSVPPGVSIGGSEYATLTAALTWQNNLVVQDSPHVTDSTTVLAEGRLLLTKTARNCGNLISASDPCSGAYATGINGKPDDVIEYRIEYRNTGSSPISLITITDPVPGFTTALSYVVWTQPNGSSLTSPDAHIVLLADPGLSVTFDLPGVVVGDVVLLQPGESGFVLYRVRVK